MLTAHTRELRRFVEDDVSFLRSVANILGTAIERKFAEEQLTLRLQPIAMACVGCPVAGS